MKPASNSLSVIEMSQSDYAVYIGIDWADQKHDICLYDPTTGELEFSVIGSQPEAIAAWAEGLRKRFAGGAIAICTEQKRGPLIYGLCKYDFFVLYPVNPQTVAKYRQAFAPSRAKADPTDAHILVELVLKHKDKLTAWQPSSAQLRALQQMVENRRMLVGEKVRLTNRLIATLKGYYPQVLEWFEDKDTQVFCEFLTRYPDLKAAQAAPKEELEQFFKSHHVVQAKTINRRLEQIQQGVVLTEDAGIVEPFQLLVNALIAQLQVLLSTIATFETKIETLFDAHPDAALFAALPGLGPSWHPACWWRLEKNETVSKRPKIYYGMRELLRCKRVAARSRGYISDGVVPNFSDKPLLSGHCKLESTRFGQRRFTRCNAKTARLIRQRFGHWHLSGYGLCFAAGKSDSRMTK